MTTESDLKLLEVVATAAGLHVDQRASFMTWRYQERLALLNEQGGHTLWNPLRDDGDALRLAEKLCLEVTPAGNYTAVRRFNTNELVTAEWGYDPYDPMAATRRAITRAAAAIGAHKEGD